MDHNAHPIPYDIVRFPHDGAIDADGHLAEPANLWEDYLEEKYRPRAIRVKKHASGLEYLEAEGRPVPRTAEGRIGTFLAMTLEGDMVFPAPERTYAKSMAYGACDARERADLMERENLQQAILYPTLGLWWEYTVHDPELTLAYMRAYNRWIVDFAAQSRGRIVPVAQMSWLDPEGSAREIARAVKAGCKGAFFTMGCPARKPPGHQDHDVVFASLQDLDVPLAMHVAFDPDEYHVPRYDGPYWESANAFMNLSLLHQQCQQGFVSYFQFGTVERFPRLRLGVLESGAGWIASLLDRMDGLYESPIFRRTCALKQKPSDYFRRQCFISCDPDEKGVTGVMDYVGPECFVWGSDYPHPEGRGSWVVELLELAERLDEGKRKLVLGENVKRIYKLGQ